MYAQPNEKKNTDRTRRERERASERECVRAEKNTAINSEIEKKPFAGQNVIATTVNTCKS